jgi:[ribosomal protein S5]-alanine N-acetyltransferase
MLTTRRLVLDAFTLADAPLVNAWKNDEQIQALSADESTSESLELTRARIGRWIADDPNQIVHWAIRLQSPRRLIGFCHAARIERRHRRCWLGLVIGAKELWGRGYGTESCAAMLRYCFEALALNRVTAETYATNAASIRMLEKLGFVREGVLRESVWRSGPVDEHVYALLRHDWLERQPLELGSTLD